MNHKYLASELEMVEGQVAELDANLGQIGATPISALREIGEPRGCCSMQVIPWPVVPTGTPALPLFMTTKILFGHPWFRREEDEN